MKVNPQNDVESISAHSKLIFKTPNKASIFCVTWNLNKSICSNQSDLERLLPLGYDIYVIGTQECLQVSQWLSSVMKYFSFVNISESGCNYTLMNSEHLQSTLSSIHMCIFINSSILDDSMISNVSSESISVGYINGLIANKGANIIRFTINGNGQQSRGNSFVFCNCHLHAHHSKVLLRNRDFHRICKRIYDTNHKNSHLKRKEIDFVFIFGDLNYRINGNRQIMDLLLKQKMFEVMLANDQLCINKEYGIVFKGFTEGKIHFKPSYKFDVGRDTYDTSNKRRIPSWTDRILYKTNENLSNSKSCIKQIEYNCIENLRISDHRPVFSIFNIELQHTQKNRVIHIGSNHMRKMNPCCDEKEKSLKQKIISVIMKFIYSFCKHRSWNTQKKQM